MKMELRKSFQFEAAHLLPLLPQGHKCARLHGHSFKVWRIVVAGECDEKLSWLMDYADISTAFKPLWGKLDHRYLSERSARPGKSNQRNRRRLDLEKAKAKTAAAHLEEWSWPETCTARAVYRGE